MTTGASEVPIGKPTVASMDTPDSGTETVEVEDSIEKVDTGTSAVVSDKSLIGKPGRETSGEGSKDTPDVTIDKTGPEASDVTSNARIDGATDPASSDEVAPSDKSGFATPVDTNCCSTQKSNWPAEAEYRDPDVSLVMNASFNTTDDKGGVFETCEQQCAQVR